MLPVHIVKNFPAPDVRVDRDALLAEIANWQAAAVTKGMKLVKTVNLREIAVHGLTKQRMERRQEEKEKQALIERRAPLLGKWLWILFWITIASLGINALTGETAVALIPALEIPGRVCSYLFQFFVIYVLFVISKEHHFFKYAALLSCGCFVINILAVFITEDQIWLLLLIALFQVAMALLADYYEYKANAEVVLVVDGRISDQWDNFWNWMLYSSIGVAVSLFLVFLIPGLGAILSVVSSIALIVARVKKIICMYRSAEAFRAKTEQNAGDE